MSPNPENVDSKATLSNEGSASDESETTEELRTEAEENADSIQEVEEATERAEEGGATTAELKALQAEKEAWIKRQKELEDKLAAAEEKSRRVIKAPVPKAEKVIEGVSDKPKRKRNLSRWFGEAAYGDDE